MVQKAFCIAQRPKRIETVLEKRLQRGKTRSRRGASHQSQALSQQWLPSLPIEGSAYFQHQSDLLLAVIGLADGTYSVEQIEKSGWNQTTDDFATVVVSGGVGKSGLDFGDASSTKSRGDGKGFHHSRHDFKKFFKHWNDKRSNHSSHEKHGENEESNDD